MSKGQWWREDGKAYRNGAVWCECGRLRGSSACKCGVPDELLEAAGYERDGDGWRHETERNACAVCGSDIDAMQTVAIKDDEVLCMLCYAKVRS